MLRQIADHPRCIVAGIANRKRNPQSRIIPAMLFEPPMLSQHVAVVRRVDHDRVVVHTKLAQVLQNGADIPVKKPRRRIIAAIIPRLSSSLRSRKMSGICGASSGPTVGTGKAAGLNRVRSSTGKRNGECGSMKLTHSANGWSCERCSSRNRRAWLAIKVPSISRVCRGKGSFSAFSQMRAGSFSGRQAGVWGHRPAPAQAGPAASTIARSRPPSPARRSHADRETPLSESASCRRRR